MSYSPKTVVLMSAILFIVYCTRIVFSVLIFLSFTSSLFNSGMSVILIKTVVLSYHFMAMTFSMQLGISVEKLIFCNFS